MKDNNKKESEILRKSRVLTGEEKKELCQNSIKRVMSFLRALDEWRAESLSSPFRY